MQAREIAKEVKEEAVRQVETTSWLTRQTRSKVMQKIATTKIMVNLLSFYLNRTAIIDSLTGIYISDKQFFSNVIMMVNHQRKQLYMLKKYVFKNSLNIRMMLMLLRLSLSEEVFTWRVVASTLSVEAYSICAPKLCIQM